MTSLFFHFLTLVVFAVDESFVCGVCGTAAFVCASGTVLGINGRSIWKEHIKFSSMLMTPPALSNSPQ